MFVSTGAIAQEDELALVLSCGTGADASEGSLALKGRFAEGEPALTTLQFFEDDKGLAAAPWPTDGESGPEKFFTSTSFGPEGAFTDIRFERDAQTWHIYDFTGPRTGEEPPDGAGGLVVLDADGVMIRSVPSVERMFAYFDVLQATAQCDRHGPLGEAACTGAEVQRTKPLSTLYPWFTAGQ